MTLQINVTKSFMPPFEEYVEAIKPLWESRWLTNMGKYHQELESRLRNYLEVQDISLMVNGHMALEMVLQAMDFPPGSEVITTPFTFISTTHAIVRSGLVPVFCDIDPVTFTLDPKKIEPLLTERTRAILPVHVYGNVCDVEAIEDIAAKHGLKVIYDAAHAFGVRYKGRGIADYGDAACFSFHATKVFHTIEGGAVCFHDEDLGCRLYQLKNFGIRDEEHVDAVGSNAKLNEFSAIMGLCNLKHIEEIIDKRKIIVERYRSCLADVSGLQLNPQQKCVESNYAYFPLLIQKQIFGVDRDVIIKRLANQGIGVRKYFYPLTSEHNCIKNNFQLRLTPIALAISRQILALPLYVDLDLKDVDRICEIVIGSRKYAFEGGQ